MESQLLLRMLMTRFAVNPKSEKFRIANAIKYWLEHFFSDFESDSEMLEVVTGFVEKFEEASDELRPLIQLIVSVLNKKVAFSRIKSLDD
jgi:hypothetical protein